MRAGIVPGGWQRRYALSEPWRSKTWHQSKFNRLFVEIKPWPFVKQFLLRKSRKGSLQSGKCRVLGSNVFFEDIKPLKKGGSGTIGPLQDYTAVPPRSSASIVNVSYFKLHLISLVMIETNSLFLLGNFNWMKLIANTIFRQCAKKVRWETYTETS